MERVVVTGIGVVSSIGIGKKDFWNNLIKGKSGIGPIETFDPKGFPTQVGGEVKKFDPNDYIKPANISSYGRASQFAVAASKLALIDSGINLDDGDADVIVGTTMGETQAIETIDKEWMSAGEAKVSKGLILQYPSNTLAMNVAHEFNLSGHAIVIPTACAAGNYAIGYGHDLIKTEQSKLVIAGGSDAFSRIAFFGFSRMYAMASLKCRPFDKKREGMLLGEGAGFVILEPMSRAIKRNAHIYAEILDYGLSCDASHMTIPSEEGMAQVMRKAIYQSGINFSEVDYISAHGTGTNANDRTESRAINCVFNEQSKKIPVSSIKSMLGHTMGAASAIEAIACLLAIDKSKIPPTINFEEEDENCAIDCVPNKHRKIKVKIALNNSFAFGGNNACLVLKRYSCEQ